MKIGIYYKDKLLRTVILPRSIKDERDAIQNVRDNLTVHALDVCAHDWQEQEGEPPFDVCISCGKVRY